METLERAEQLKAELDSLRPLDPDVERRVMQKLRLDWNYHSNKLEGNTYSYGETKMLLMKGLTAGGKPVRDHEEISGHDQAISFIIESIEHDEPLTEIFIRHLHKLILVRPFWSDAKTVDGQPTKRLIKVGEYKTEPNHVETQSGNIFYFAEPIETPAKMQELVEWFRNKSQNLEENFIKLSTEFHYRFVRIHPFDDGNGRLARLLMNYILMKQGFPPVIIKTEDKDNYIAVLEQADFAILKPFVEYVAQNLISSLELIIRGARGGEIEDSDDLDKELTMLDAKLSAAGLKNTDSVKTTAAIKRIHKSTVLPLTSEFIAVCKKFDRFYSASQFQGYVNQTGRTSPIMIYSTELFTRPERFFDRHLTKITLSYLHEGLNKNETFDHTSYINLDFGETHYKFSYEDGKTIYEKSYSNDLSRNEITRLLKDVAAFHKSYIERKIGESKGQN